MWVKISDEFYDDPKLERVGVGAVGTFVRILSYCAKHLTDGEIPEKTALRFADGDHGLVADLLDIGVLTNGGPGTLSVPKFTEYNPSRRTREQQRAEWRERQRRHRRRVTAVTRDKRVTTGTGTGSSGSTDASVSPTSSSSPSANEASEGEPEYAVKLAAELARLVADNGRPAHLIQSGSWAREARLMVERDKRDPREAWRVLRWCQADEFWRGNILSMAKFRKQYDQLRHKAKLKPQKADALSRDEWLARYGRGSS